MPETIPKSCDQPSQKGDGDLWQGFSYSNVGKAIGSTIPKFNINGCYKLLLILVKVNQLYYYILTFTMIDSYETIFNQKTDHCEPFLLGFPHETYQKSLKLPAFPPRHRRYQELRVLNGRRFTLRIAVEDPLPEARWKAQASLQVPL